MDYIYFGSGARGDYKCLSNFSHCTMTLRAFPKSFLHHQPALATWFPQDIENIELSFPSVEHLYQSLKARDKHTFLRFTNNGDIGSWNPNVFLMTTITKKKAKIAKRLDKQTKTLSQQDMIDAAKVDMNFWKKKNMIGIQAKLAANADYGSALGLGTQHMNYEKEYLSAEEEANLWHDLETLKYKQNPRERTVLKGTGSALLVEFDKGAKRHHVHWGGLVEDNDGGQRVLGDNAMGKYLMRIREQAICDNW
jgi:hypothetical protein